MERVMSQKNKTLRRIPQTTLRRLRYTPTYFFLIWRWTWWLFAFIWIMFSPMGTTPVLLLILGITFVQSLVVTLYTPVFKIFFPKLPGNFKRSQQERHILWARNRPRPISVDED